MEEIINKISNNLLNVRDANPLTHCITNVVTTNDCANAILAVGASPIMADDELEIEEIVNISNTLVINIGKLSTEQIKSFHKGCEIASKTNVPIVLDPVGCGISNLRNTTTLDIVNNYNITAIRGNMSEVKAIANLLKIIDTTTKSKGVDVSESDIITKDNLVFNGEIVKKLALKTNSVVIASGPIDIISDGNLLIAIENGDSMMEHITGSGCMLSSIVGSFVGANDPLIGSITASLLMSIAGENAREFVDNNNLGTGSFRASLIDNLSTLEADEIIEKGNIYLIK